jgi:hypothetical protein
MNAVKSHTEPSEATTLESGEEPVKETRGGTGEKKTKELTSAGTIKTPEFAAALPLGEAGRNAGSGDWPEPRPG